MAWEDRTPTEKKQAATHARRNRATDDQHQYEVTTGGARYTVTGIRSARIIAGPDGTIRRIT